MISLQLHYKSGDKSGGSSKTRWSELGHEFAIYARKIVKLVDASSVGVGPPSEDLSRRLATLEARLQQQHELMERLLATMSATASGGAGGAAAGPPAASAAAS